jgi:hypothetical protein
MLRHRKKHSATSALYSSSRAPTERSSSKFALCTAGSGSGRDEAYDDNSDLVEYLFRVQGSIIDKILQSKFPADEAARLLRVQTGEY